MTPGFGRAQEPDSLAQGQTPGDAVDPVRQPGINPFSGFETHFLANGLKVWFKRLPDAPNVSVSIAVPFGSHWYVRVDGCPQIPVV